MNILNKEELKRQIQEGKEISLDGILEEFKNLLRESIQTASEEELTSHLGYDKLICQQFIGHKKYISI